MAATFALRERIARDLVVALQDGDLSSIERILSSGADPNLLLDPEGISPMHLFLGPDAAHPLTVTRLLLRHGGNPNVRSCEGLTPVHVCAAWGRADIIRLLLKYGGDPNLLDFDGNSVVSLALENGHLEVVDLLHSHCDIHFRALTRLHVVDAQGDRLMHYSPCTATIPTEKSVEIVASKLVGAGDATADAKDSSTKTALSRDSRVSTSDDGTLNRAYLSVVCSEPDSCDTYCTVDEFLLVENRAEVALIERQYLQCGDGGDGGGGSSSSFHSVRSAASSKAESVPASLADLPDDLIRLKLRCLGQSPGPVTPSTRRVYLRRLHWLQKGGQEACKRALPRNDAIYSPQLSACLAGLLSIESYKNLEVNFSIEFDREAPLTSHRGGVIKNCFNYLLLDPRVSQNLPQRVSDVPDAEALRTFVAAVFYVGKGQQARAYDHFYEALRTPKSATSVSKKVRRIQEIWTDGYGVISLQFFQGTTAAEAFTREACMIDAIGKANLTNERVGNYYGQVKRWVLRDKCKLGSVFLHRAASILLQEGERQIFPFNLAKPKHLRREATT